MANGIGGRSIIVRSTDARSYLDPVVGRSVFGIVRSTDSRSNREIRPLAVAENVGVDVDANVRSTDARLLTLGLRT